MLKSLRLSPNRSITSPGGTSKVLENVKFVEYQHKRVAQCASYMAKQFGSSDLRKPSVESASTMARLPREFERFAAPWMPEIEMSARFNRTVQSDEKYGDFKMWNTIFTRLCHEAEQSGNFKSTRLSAAGTAI